MKIRALELYWNPGPNTVAAEVRDYLSDAPEVRNAIARMARGEVKNYLAALAEDAGLPFGDAIPFLRSIRSRTQVIAELNDRGLTLYGPSADDQPSYPFEVGGYANHPEQAEQDARPFSLLEYAEQDENRTDQAGSDA